MALFTSINDGTFPTLSDLDVVRLIGSSFESELRWLKEAIPTVESSKGTTAGALGNGRLTPSSALYGTDYPEVNRTLVSMLAVKWLMTGDYQTFTCCQNLSTKLKPESFQRLRDLLVESCPVPETIYALLVAIVVNDLGKNEDQARLVTNITGQTYQNHDDVVHAAANEHFFPSIESMEPDLRADILLGLELGSRLNIAQFAQAECVAASLEGVLIMNGRNRAFALKLMEVILDVSGASGHIDSCCAAQMTEPVFQTYLTIHETLLNIIEKRITPQEGYDCIFLARHRLLRDAGFQKELSTQDPADRALLRLLTMGRVVDRDRADCFVKAFEDLAPDTKQNVVDLLNVNGVDGQAAIIFFYAPALISEALKNTDGPEHEVQVLGALMRLLTRIHDREKARLHRQESNIRTINLSFAQETIRSEEFSKNPKCLDSIPIPPNI